MAKIKTKSRNHTGAFEDCTEAQRKIAWVIAQGRTQREAAEAADVTEDYVWQLLNQSRYAGYQAMVDKLTLEIGIAQKAERIRIAKRLVRQRLTEDGKVRSQKDVLDWLKFAKDEMEPLEINIGFGTSPALQRLFNEYERVGEEGAKAEEVGENGS